MAENNNMVKMANQNKQQNPVTIWDLFNRPLSSFASFSPFAFGGDDFKVDIKDEGADYKLTADMPGVKKEDLKVDFDDGMLTISAKHHSVKEEQDEQGYMLKERTEGSYSRSFNFDNVDSEKIEAAFADGVLTITLGKSEPTAKVKSIAVK
ncbi:MAG: Hsp20/alpha crystallin family protein [Candidatus Anaerobiospirillum merdipullorum]|uniref:Hsp20/alpha crystallin family protein n=1 Tax=Candidatus Anaerobiospirillum merdipullorum TaxID=2838450 RepID=A0A9E2NS02_9GAMM|nr:Hsp20/alpha crystallin family protein [Candidatus Anaerobiospirillum merdipullorum]